MRRFAMLSLSVALVLGLTGLQHLFAQGDAKKETPAADSKKKDEAPAKPDAAKTEPAKTDAAKTEPAKAEAGKAEPAKAEAEPPLPPIPPEVEAKLEAARKAVAEAIVAAEDAGLVNTSIEPPPILDILVTGRANDEKTLKARKGASPEVFGAWWTGYGKTATGIVAKDVRIVRPEGGLQVLFDQRASALNKYIEAARKAKGPKPAAEPKKEEAKKAEPKKEESKKEEPKKDEPKKEASKTEASKK